MIKVELGDELKVGKTVLQIQSNSLLPNQVKERKDINLYEKVLVSNINTMNKNKSQMEQWSILNDNIVYVRSEGNDVMNGIDIKMVDYQDHRRMYRRMGKEEGERLNIDFGESPNVLKDKYMDVYEDICAEVVTTNRFDENVDLSTTYLGRCRFLILFLYMNQCVFSLTGLFLLRETSFQQITPVFIRS